MKTRRREFCRMEGEKRMGFKVLIPEDIAESGKAFLRQRGYEIVVLSGMDREALRREGRDTDAIIARTGAYPEDILEQMPKLKVIARHGVGYNNIPVAYCEERGIFVTITPEANGNAVAEGAIMLMLASARNLVYQAEQVKAGNWAARNKTMGLELSGKTLGIAGCGRIGRMVAAKAALGLDMKVLGYDPLLPTDSPMEHMECVATLEELCERADFVSLHMPETEQTRGMFGSALFRKMGPDATLINCARGGVVNEQELVAALRDGVIRGAALDVTVQEPIPADHPLLQLPNVIVTPHNTAINRETMDRISLHAAQCVDAALRGQTPPWTVTHFPVSRD